MPRAVQVTDPPAAECKRAPGCVAGELGAVANLAVRQPESALVLDREGLLERLTHHE